MKKRPGGPHVREEVEARAGGGATVDWELHMAASKSSKIGICEGSSVQLIHQAPRKYVSAAQREALGAVRLRRWRAPSAHRKASAAVAAVRTCYRGVPPLYLG